MTSRTARSAGIAALFAASVACAQPRSPEAVRPPRVTIRTTSGATAAVTAEVARTPETRERGLMFRTKLDPDAGMLFVFDESEDHTFWMKNTPLPLDMIFIGEDGRIVGIVERATPFTLQGRSVGAPSRYVLEVNGGWAAAHGVHPGDDVAFENVGR